MSDVVDKILGVGGGVSAVLAFIFYKCYKSRGEFAEHVKKAPHLQPDGSLFDLLKDQDQACIAYAAIEGIVKDLGRTISSHHLPVRGVMMTTKLTEHKSKRVNGFWSESKKDLRDNLQSVPFALFKTEDPDPKYKVEIVNPQAASHLQQEMDITYDKFEPHKSSLVGIGIDRLFGEINRGIQETERMLVNGTSVLAFGRVFLERGRAKLGPPMEDKYSFIVTKMSLGELVASFESQSKMFKVLSIISALLGGGLIIWLAWRKLKKWLQKREQRIQFENIRRALQSQENRTEPAANTANETNNLSDGDVNDGNCCVICLTNERQVIALPCGHVSSCLSCVELLPEPKKCPICRINVERFMQAFFS